MTEQPKQTITIPYSEWGLGFNVYNYIMQTVPPGSSILEFGSGESSRVLNELGYEVWSVEENEEFVGVIEGVNYIYAPIDQETNWYDEEALYSSLPTGKSFHTVIVDGPTTSRDGFVQFINSPWAAEVRQYLFDDIHRHDDRESFFKVLAAHNNTTSGEGSIFIMPTGQLIPVTQGKDVKTEFYDALFGVLAGMSPLVPSLPREQTINAQVAGAATFNVPSHFIAQKEDSKDD
jgi:hypothetical protein